MSQETKARTFSELHRKGDPVILFNIWDAGSAKAVADSGAKALATGSWSVAGAQGYGDGEALPLDLLEVIVKRIAATTELPLSVDFEGAYATGPTGVGKNIARMIAAGAVGVNFEDQKIGGSGLYPVAEQAARISSARSAAEDAGLPFFINARTDLFLKDREPENHPALMAEAIARARAYAEAGASGIFMPGLKTPDLIRQAVEAVELPLNILMMPGVPEPKELASLGVSRISYGPGPWREMMAWVTERAGEVYGA
ncbi:isocitrate lyase/phosphoenolpyruvate mutase family protein [Nisaea acidiphila]|uniref:Isocitrate lyase/phosphoenolpyruvate mutase family protein n=1 Tax=Nisaea acidiphila TaxID=1862145 RepID=A0A9J7AZ27_9PROT|nr:isocitrate lyase/phosphoenolpyruvate mutase family protein [Nisaea acidiphila]UUX51516.1 isocitrate lyase/phosphoenolpyruvate mutase family protein [Nisaea acidiphila]